MKKNLGTPVLEAASAPKQIQSYKPGLTGQTKVGPSEAAVSSVFCNDRQRQLPLHFITAGVLKRNKENLSMGKDGLFPD